MSFDAVMATIGQLTASTEALAALGVRLQAEAEGIPIDVDVGAALDRVVGALGIDLAELDARQLTIAASTALGFFRLAADLVENPDRAPGWEWTDPSVLRSLGQASAVIAEVIAGIAPQLDGLGPALAGPGAAFLDVGSGVGALATAICRIWPAVKVVGLEPWEAAMRLAQLDLAGSQLRERIELRPTPIEALDDSDSFDAVWLAGPFLPLGVVPTAVKKASAALHPGGWLLFGFFAGQKGALVEEVLRLRVIRTGGHPFLPGEAEELMVAAGFAGVRTVERTWPAPVGFVVGQRPRP